MKRLLLGLFTILALANTAFGQVGNKPTYELARGRNVNLPECNMWVEGDITTAEDVIVGGDFTLTDDFVLGDALLCDTDGGCTIGSSSSAPDYLYFSNGTVKGSLNANGTNAYLGTTSNHGLNMVVNNSSRFRWDTATLYPLATGKSLGGTSDPAYGWSGLHMGDGTAAASLKFTGNVFQIGTTSLHDVEFLLNGGNVMHFSASGAIYPATTSWTLGHPSNVSTTFGGIYLGDATDGYNLTVDPDALAINHTTAAAGSKMNIKSVEELITIAVGQGAGGVVSSSNLCPVGHILSVSARVTDAAGGGATDVDLGCTGGNDDLFIDQGNDAFDLTAIDTTAAYPGNGDHTATALVNHTATTMTLTTNANVTGDDAIVRVVVYYIDTTAPTS